jgi:hypothetical protein
MSRTILVRHREVEVVTALKAILIVIVIASLVASCWRTPPVSPELSFRTTYNGVARSCTALVFNSNGVQIMEVSSDISGNGYIPEIQPGAYTIKFKDAQGKLYPAVRAVTVAARCLQNLDVELTK